MSIFASLFLSPAKSLLIAAAVFIPFERLARLHPTQRTFRQGWTTDVLTGLMNGLLLYGMMIIVFAQLDAVAAICIPDLRTWVETRSIWAQAVMAVALGDLGVYASTGCSIACRGFGGFMPSITQRSEMDWLVGFRFHPVDLFLVRVASLGPLVALHMTPAAIGMFHRRSPDGRDMLVHANVRVPTPVRSGGCLFLPSFTTGITARESRDPRHQLTASIVACWDVVFGTMHLPRGRQPLRYGVDEPVPAGLAKQFFHPFRTAGAVPLVVAQP